MWEGEFQDLLLPLVVLRVALVRNDATPYLRERLIILWFNISEADKS